MRVPERRLRLSERKRASMGIEARARAPREACGLLVGRRHNDVVEVLEVHPAQNIALAPERYEVDPADNLETQRLARARDLEVVGVWHSHPEGPATPSESDRREALPGWVYVIVDARSGECRAWLAGEGGFVELELAG